MLEIKFLNVVILHLETLCILSLQTQERGPDDMLCRAPRSLSYYWLLSLFLLSFIAFCLFPLFLFFIIFTTIKAAVKMFLPLSVLSALYLRDIFL